MKPKIDLNSPIVRFGLDHYNNQVEIALNTDQSVEKSVIPIYIIPNSKAHQKPKTKPEQTGTGVLVNIKDQYFIFTATHVLLDFDGKGLLTADGNGTRTQQIAGERFSTGHIATPKSNKLDASVFHVQSEISKSLTDLAVTLDHFDFENLDSTKPIFMASGFRSKVSNTSRNSVNSKREAFPSIEFDQEYYEILNIDSQSQIILSYEDQVLVNGNWQISPVPRGMSGGAIIKVLGTDVKIGDSSQQIPRQLLTGITIEHHREKHNNPGFLVGTRINVFLGLIHQFLPGFLDDFLQSYQTLQESKG